MQSTQLSKCERLEANETLAVLVKVCGELIKKTGSGDTCSASDMANTILNTYWNLKIDEVILVLQWGFIGRFGKIYGKLTEMTVIDWFNQYDALRDAEIENNHRRRKIELSDRSERTNSIEQSWRAIPIFLKKKNE